MMRLRSDDLAASDSDAVLIQRAWLDAEGTPRRLMCANRECEKKCAKKRVEENWTPLYSVALERADKSEGAFV